jgi:hypothetical protein
VRSIFKICLAIYTVVLCLMIPVAAAAQPRQKTQPAKNQLTGPGKVIFFYPRPETSDAPRQSATLAIDGQDRGTVFEGEQLALTLEPGNHRVIVGDTLFKSGTPIAVLPGQIQYFAITLDNGLTFIPVDAAAAKAELSRKQANGVGAICFYWPRALLDHSSDELKKEVMINVDGKRVGAIVSGYYIVAQVSAGKHQFVYEGDSVQFGRQSTTIFVGSRQTKYYQIDTSKDFELHELPSEMGRLQISDLKRR